MDSVKDKKFLRKSDEEYVVTVVLAGSYRKFFSEVQDLIKFFEQNKISVLAPAIGKAVNLNEEFVHIDSNGTLTSEKIECEFL